ncbi:MAG: RHS repeat-associated core domain-containing protein [Candidatus Schekmanbacteria bacterium]|nr:RHS repeat-associated core domain-containing protein [Candidatus Schekmanbacteria bacterium]
MSGSVTMAWNDDFQVAAESVNGAHTVDMAYDGDGLLAQAGGLALTRDSTGGRVERVDGTDTTYRYAYDLVGRLERVWENGAEIAHYTYDANGNRLSEDPAAAEPIASYDDQDRLVTRLDATYAYSLDGVLAARTDGAGTTSYDYDALGNLRSAVLPDGRAIDYVVDGLGRRVGKRVDGVLVAGWLYGSQLRVAAELDGTGNVVSRFVPGGVVRGGVTYGIVRDERGSVRLVVDTTSGAVAQRMEYDAWGRVLVDTNPGFQPFGFAGGLYDPDTGFVRFGARDYDPEVGRWTSRDPVYWASGQPNLYEYVGGDPINLTDVTGYYSIPTGTDPAIEERIHDAMTELREQMASTSCISCKEYFAKANNPQLKNMEEWTKNNGQPPYFMIKDRESTTEKDIKGHAQKTMAFTNIYLFRDIFTGPMSPCTLASILLHEGGHLARMDTVENEPADFFNTCRIGCVLPGRFR